MPCPPPASADPLSSLAGREGVASAVASARDAVDALLRDRGLRRVDAADTVESLLRGAAASAVLEGSASSIDDLRAGVADRVAQGAVRVSAELLGLLPTWRHSPVQALARLHALAADADEPTRGRPVSTAGAARLRDLAHLVQQPTSAPAMVLAAVVHAEVITAQAFPSRNGVVARAAERLVLVASGVDPASVTVPEAGHARSPQAYVQALAGYGSGGSAGVVAWVLHAADAYAYGVEQTPLARR